MLLDNTDLNEFKNFCTGDSIRTPLIKFLPDEFFNKKILLIGSCIANYLLRKELKFNNSLLLFNGGKISSLEKIIDNFDLVVLQMPLRFMIKDGEFWNLRANDENSFELLFEKSVNRLKNFLEQSSYERKNKPFFVMNFIVPVLNPTGKTLDRYSLANFQHFVERLNFELFKLIKNLPNTFLIDTDAIASTAGKYRISDEFYNHLNHAAPGEVDLTSNFMEEEYSRIEKMPAARLHYDLDENNVFGKMLANEITQISYTLFESTPIKMIVVDLDNTLWRGVVGEELSADNNFQHNGYVKNFYNGFGIEDLDYYKLAEGFPYGIMEALHFCKKRGILLGIISKNNENDGLEGLKRIYSGLIDLSNFIGIKINWNSKSQNMQELLNIANISSGNTLFIDDNPLERQMMEEAFPDLKIIGKHLFFAKNILHNSHLTSTIKITQESENRTTLVKSASVLRESLADGADLSAFDIKASIVEVSADPASQYFIRALELINKTNQFNINGKRVSSDYLLKTISQGGKLYSLSVKDKYIDHGLVGFSLINNQLVDCLAISCRVIGLGVEDYFLSRICQLIDMPRVELNFINTEKNFPAQIWVNNSCEITEKVYYIPKEVVHINQH